MEGGSKVAVTNSHKPTVVTPSLALLTSAPRLGRRTQVSDFSIQGSFTMDQAVRAHKRERSLYDSTEFLTGIAASKNQLRKLRKELHGIPGTGDEIEKAMAHVAALESILDSSKKLVSFSIILVLFIFRRVS